MRIPENWTFAEGRSLMIIPNTEVFREIPITLSPLKNIIMRSNEGGKTYISAARYFLRRHVGFRTFSPQSRDSTHFRAMFIRMSVSRVTLSIGVNPSAQELNDTLLAVLQPAANVCQIRQEVRMLNGYSWAITTLNCQNNITYALWQFVDNEYNHYIIEFQTDNLSTARRTIEYIMQSFSSYSS